MVKARRRILKDVSVISVHCNMISFQLFYIDKGASLLGWLNFKRLDFNVTRLEKRPKNPDDVNLEKLSIKQQKK